MSADVVRQGIRRRRPGCIRAAALEDVAGRWLSLGPELVVITCGGYGAMALRGTRTVLHRAGLSRASSGHQRRRRAFTAALLAGLCPIEPGSARLTALSSEDLAPHALDTCVAAAGLSMRTRGTDLPTTTRTEGGTRCTRTPGLRSNAHLAPPHCR